MEDAVNHCHKFLVVAGETEDFTNLLIVVVNNSPSYTITLLFLATPLPLAITYLLQHLSL